MSLPVLVALVAALFIGSTALGLAIGYGIERWCSRRVWSVAMPATQLRHEVRGNVTFIAVSIATLSLVLHFDLARAGGDSAARVALTFVALFFGFQVFHYANLKERASGTDESCERA